MSLDAHHVAVGLEETNATCIELRLVGTTNTRQPTEDFRVSLAMRLYPQDNDDDDDDLLNVARTVELELRLENERGRAARTEGCFSSQPQAAAWPSRSSQSRLGRNRSL